MSKVTAASYRVASAFASDAVPQPDGKDVEVCCQIKVKSNLLIHYSC